MSPQKEMPDLRLSTMWYIIPRHKLVARYCVFMLAVRVYVRSLYVSPSVRTSFPFDSLSIYKRISFKFCICICTNNVSLGIVIGDKFRQFITELWRLSMYKKCFLASSSFTIWNIMIKHHKYDLSNKSSILA